MLQFKARAARIIPVVAFFSAFFFPCFVQAFSLEVAEAPATTLSLTVSAIQSARHELLLNIYELSSLDVADALIERIRAGVHVEVIEEGQPVGGLSAVGRGIQAQIAQAMRSASRGDHLFEMTSHAQSQRRFRFNHGKYAVVDGKSLLIGSENYSPTGNPHAGTQGNRGWEVFIHNSEIALDYERIFHADSNLAAGDLLDLTQENKGGPGQLDDAIPVSGGDLSHHRGRRSSPVFAPWDRPIPLEADSVRRISSPDSSRSGLVAMLRGAKHTLDIEQMTFDSAWGKDGEVSPLFDEVIAAARRGVKVRVLLNDESVFDHPGHPRSPKNQPTVDRLNQLAKSEGLSLSAAIADIHAMGVSYIHNKGALVDGTQTLISSINWNWNSVENNREAAVLVTGATIHAHYKTLFDSDWSMRASSSPRCLE